MANAHPELTIHLLCTSGPGNSPLPSPYHILQLALGVVGWFVVFGLVQQGLYQVRDEQIQIARSRLAEISASA